MICRVLITILLDEHTNHHIYILRYSANVILRVFLHLCNPIFYFAKQQHIVQLGMVRASVALGVFSIKLRSDL